MERSRPGSTVFAQRNDRLSFPFDQPLYRTKQESTLHEIDPLRNHPSSCVLTSFLILPRMGSGIWGVLSQFLRLKTSPSENLPAGFGPGHRSALPKIHSSGLRNTYHTPSEYPHPGDRMS